MNEHLDKLFEGTPEVLDVEEVAALMHVSRATVYMWISAKTIPAYKLGKTWRILRDEFKAALQASSNKLLEEDQDDG